MTRTDIRLLLPLLALLLTACATSNEFTASESSGFTFIHMNDTYRIDAVEDGSKGGFGRIVTVIRRLQSEGRNVRLLHAGDFLYPSLESQLWNGQQMIAALNYMDDLAPLITVIGNHEMDRSTAGPLIDAVRASRFEWLGDNYRFNTGAPDVDAALRSLFTFEQGDKTIGVFALTVDPLDVGSIRDYVDVDTDYDSVAARSIRQLEDMDVDMIIGLTHLHMYDDLRIAGLRRDHPKFVFIAGGHEHEVHYSPMSRDSAAVIKGASNARVVWRIDVDFDADDVASIEATALSMDNSVRQDPGFQVLNDKWRTELLRLYPIIGARLGTANIRMNVTEESVRKSENPWGNFIVDVARSAFGEPKSDLAFINSGSIRIDDYIAGDIIYEDIARTFGFPSQLRRIDVTGAEFVAMMEAGYRGTGSSHGYFPQVSGFRVCIDRSKPDYKRIVSLQLNGAGGWREIEADKTYSLILPDFIFGDRDGYVMPKGARDSASLPGAELKYLVVDAIARAQFDERGVGAEVDPENPRFVALGPQRQRCWSNR